MFKTYFFPCDLARAFANTRRHVMLPDVYRISPVSLSGFTVEIRPVLKNFFETED